MSIEVNEKVNIKDVRLLLVDDDLLLINRISNELQTKGFNITKAESGEEALRLLDLNYFNIVITDLIMNKVDGFSILKKAKMLYPDIMVIILTGYGNTKFIIDSLRLGADDYLFKPYDSEDLFFRITRCLESQKLKKNIIKLEKDFKESENIFKTFMDYIPVQIYINDSDCKVLYLNKEHNKVYNSQGCIGKHISSFLPEKTVDCITSFNKKVHEQGFQKSKINVPDSDGQNHYYQTLMFPIERKDKKPIFGGIALDITKQVQAEKEIKDADALKKSIIDSPVKLNIWSVDKNYRYTFFNQYHKQGMKKHWNADIKIGDNVLDFLKDPEYRKEVKSNYDKGLSGLSFTSFDKLIDNSGNPQYYENIGSPIFNKNGEITGVTIFTLARTAQIEAENKLKQSLKEKDILLKEVYHRVKNNLAIISSLINLQKNYIYDERDMYILDDLINRVQSIALIHQKLYESKNLSDIDFFEYVNELVNNLIQSASSTPQLIKTEIDVHERHFNIDTLIPLGIIITELVANSIKHAFPEGSGVILIKLKTDPDKYRLIVSNNGTPFPDKIDYKNSESLGLRLVCSLTEQINGSIKLDNSGGAEFIISFPKD